MSSSNAVYIASISGGKCIENAQESKGVCRLRKWNTIPAQQWIVEADEEDERQVAFKSVADGQYLATLEPNRCNGGKIGVAGEKQWWEMVPAVGPQRWHVKSKVCDGAFLNDEWGRMNDDNKIQTYKFENGNPGFNTFYLSSVEAADNKTVSPFASAGSASDAQTGRQEELDAREQELQKREDACAKNEKTNTESTQALQKTKDELAKREEEAARLKRELDTANAKLKKDASEQSEAIEAREAAATKKEEEIARRERELAASSKQQQAANTQQEKDKDESKEAQADAPAATASADKPNTATPGSNAKTATNEDAHETCRLLRENDSLKSKLKIGELEEQLRRQTCQHKIKRPPRKLDHKVAGYVYK